MLNKYFSTAPSDFSFSMGISGGRKMSNGRKDKGFLG
jgi:hypothetical protein